MVSQEEDSQVTNTWLAKVQVMGRNFVQLSNICFQWKNFTKSLETIHWQTDWSFLLTIPSLEQPHLIFGPTNMISRPTRYWFLQQRGIGQPTETIQICLLYTSDAADEEDSVDLGGRRII